MVLSCCALGTCRRSLYSNCLREGQNLTLHVTWPALKPISYCVTQKLIIMLLSPEEQSESATMLNVAPMQYGFVPIHLCSASRSGYQSDAQYGFVGRMLKLQLILMCLASMEQTVSLWPPMLTTVDVRHSLRMESSSFYFLMTRNSSFLVT